MKPSNKALKSNERYEVFKYLKENKNIIKITRGYWESIVEPHRGHFACKNTNKSFINFKNNSDKGNRALYNNGWGIEWGVILVGKETLVNSYTETNQSVDSNTTIMVNDLHIFEDFLKDELKGQKLWPYLFHQSVTCLCTNRGNMVFIAEVS